MTSGEVGWNLLGIWCGWLLVFLAKFSSPTSNEIVSSLGYHFIPATLMLSPSFDRSSLGSSFEKVTPFRQKPPLFTTVSKSSALSLAACCDSSPKKQSSIYISSSTTWLTFGYRPWKVYSSVVVLFHFGCLKIWHHISMFWLPSLLGACCGPSLPAKCNAVNTNVSLWASQCCTSFGSLYEMLCGEKSIGWVIPPACSYCLFPLPKCCSDCSQIL